MTGPGGFKVADAYADFRIDVDDAIGKAAGRLKAKGAEFAKMGENAAKAFNAGFSKGLDLDKGFKGELAKLKARSNEISRMGNQAGEGYGRGFKSGVNLRTAMVEQVAVVKSARPAFAREGKQAGDAYARGFGGTRIAGPSVSGGGGGAESAGEEMARSTARGFTKGGREVESATQRVAQRAEAKFSALKFAALSAGLPAAATAGVVAAGGVLAGGVALFAGLGIAMAVQADRPRAAWLKTANDITAKAQDMATVFDDVLVVAAKNVGDSFTRMAPLIARGMSEAVPQVDSLVHSLTDAAEDALPGLVKAVTASGPAIDGFGNLIERTGAGAGDMFVNISRGSVDAGQGLREFGGITRDLLGFTGQLVTNLASNHQELGVLNGALSVTENALLKATESGSGFVGFLHGFGQTASGALGVVSGFSNILSALPPQVTSFGGSLTATSMLLGKFGIDAGKGFDGLPGKIKAAEGATGKLKAAGEGLISGAFNPAAIATFGLSILLDELGRRQQEAAQKAQAHKEAVRELTDALRTDGGVVGDATRQTVSKALADKNAAGNAAALGISMSTVTAAALGNSVATETVKHHTDNLINTWIKQGKLGGQNQWMLDAQVNSLRENGGAAEDAAYDHGTLSEAEQNTLKAALNLTGAIATQVAQAKLAKDAYDAQEMGLNGLTSAQLRQRDAAIETFNANNQLINSQLGLRGAVMNTQDATDNYNKVMKDHTATTRDKEKATFDLERAQQAEITAAYAQGLANSKGATDVARAADAMKAANVEAVSLANAFAGPLPASLQATIGKMDVTSAQAAGLKVKIDGVGNAVYVLPNGKEIKLTGDNQQALDAVNAVQRALDNMRNKTVTLTIAQRGSSSAGITPTGSPVFSAGGNLLMPRGGDGAEQPVQFFAGGGTPGLRPMSGSRATMVKPNTWRVVGDNMTKPELFAPLDGSNRTKGFILQAAAHEGLLSAASEALSAARAGRLQEDYSTIGGSANLNQYNDALAAMSPLRSFDAGAQSQKDMANWLQAYVAQATAANIALPRMVSSAVARAVAASPALRQPPATIYVTPPAGMDYNVIAEKVSRIMALRGK